MRACATSSGGVMFIPDEIERKVVKSSYRQFAEEEAPEKLEKPFGRKSYSQNKSLRDAA